MPAIDNFWAVVPAGGAGTRLWPVSRASSPKFLHDLTGSGRTLLQQTGDRLRPLTDDRLLVVTGELHRDAVMAQLPEVAPDRVVAEPSPRDSMAAIGLAAAQLELVDPDAVLGSFAADHVIAEPELFHETVRVAAEAARSGWLVTIGIEPTFAATGFGYIHEGEALPAHEGVRKVRGFVEKPSAEVADRYLASGEYRWNAGMFVVRPGILLDLLAEGHPAFADALRELAAHPELIRDVWPTLPRIAIDHAVAEPAAEAGRVATVPAAFGWDDVGDFHALSDLVPGEGPVRVLGDEQLVRVVESSGLVVPGSGRTVAVVGLADVVVVDTPDAVLVTSRERAQDVKQIVAQLKDAGRADLT